MMHQSVTWHDSQFKEENLALYSEQATSRGNQLTNVSYRLLLNLSDSEETGFEGTIRVTFGLNSMPTGDKPLFLDF